jgi:glycosyltransferase involved in cell wall biosynthesis
VRTCHRERSEAISGLLRSARNDRAARSKPIQFGFVGSILPHKGLHVAVEAFRGIDPSVAVLRAWGNAAASPEYTRRLLDAGVSAFTLEGTFAESEKPAIFESLDVLLVPSIGLESFGLAAREAMVHGVPVIATADGALTEMFEPGTCGELFPSGDSAALAAIIRRLAASPQILDGWIARLPKPKSVEEHAEEIEEVYSRVLAKSSRKP